MPPLPRDWKGTEALRAVSAWRQAVGEASWLDEDRARAWTSMLGLLAALWAGFLLAGQVLAHGEWGGLGRDFTCFYAAGRIAAEGRADLVFDQAALWAAERAIQPAIPYQPFLYPPPFLLACRLLAALPYWPAFAVFIGAGLAPLVWLCRRLGPKRMGILPVLAFPGVIFCLTCGQNGLISASLLAGFALCADPRPVMAGICLGLLAYKPQLAALAPVLLAVSGRWRSFLAAAGSFAVFCAASLLVLGPAAWRGFAHFAQGGGQTFSALAVSKVQQARITSAFDAAILAGASPRVAFALQAMVAGAVLAVLIRFAARRPSGQSLGAALCAGALLITPYTLDYDLVVLAPALAILAARGVRHGFPPFARVSLGAAYALPLFATLLAVTLGVQIAPLVEILLLAAILRADMPVRLQDRAVAQALPA